MNRTSLYVRMLLFAAVYGFVLINWVDLFGSQMPAYHIWLILMYFAPALVTIVMQGMEDIDLAIAMGIFSSLMNDLFFFVAGNLLFGFHVSLVQWYKGQLGLYGWKMLFTFQGGPLRFPVYSWLMGLSIYARITVVIALSELWLRKQSINTSTSQTTS